MKIKVYLAHFLLKDKVGPLCHTYLSKCRHLGLLVVTADRIVLPSRKPRPDKEETDLPFQYTVVTDRQKLPTPSRL